MPEFVASDCSDDLYIRNVRMPALRALDRLTSLAGVGTREIKQGFLSMLICKDDTHTVQRKSGAMIVCKKLEKMLRALF